MEVSANASGRICILTDALYMNAYQAQEKRVGPWTEDAFGTQRWISRLCDALSCLKKAAGSLMARRLSDLTAAVWFVFLCASKYIKLALFLYTSLVPSGSSLTKPAVFTVFRDSCQSARKHYHRKGGWSPCLFWSSLIQLPKRFPIKIQLPKHWNQYFFFLTQ